MTANLVAEKRDRGSRSIIRNLRRQGRVPAVIYGKGLDNLLIHLDEAQMQRCLQEGGRTALLNLQVEGKTYRVMVREAQRDTIKGKLLHVDFVTVRLDEPVDTEVNIELEGEPKGVKEGGVLQVQLRSVTVRCLPNQIPNELVVDVSELEIGDTVTLSALKLPEGVELLSETDEIIASILPPQHGNESEEKSEEVEEEETAE